MSLIIPPQTAVTQPTITTPKRSNPYLAAIIEPEIAKAMVPIISIIEIAVIFIFISLHLIEKVNRLFSLSVNYKKYYIYYASSST